MSGAFKFIKAAIQDNLKSQEICYKLSLFSSVYNQLTRLSSNSLYILVNVKTIIKGMDFSKINIADISLSGSYFKNCNFSDSKFMKLNLNGIHLSQTDLSRIYWKDIYTNDLTIYKADKDIKDVCYSIDGKYIIGCGRNLRDGVIWMWDKLSGQLINTFQCANKRMVYIKQIQDDLFISIVFDYNDEVQYYGVKIFDGQFKQQGTDIIIHKDYKLFTHNNSLFAIAGDDNIIRIYSILEQNLLYYLQLQIQSNLIQMSQIKDQIYSLSIEQGIIVIWDFQTNNTQEIRLPEIEGTKRPKKLIFSNTFKCLLIHDDREVIRFYQIQNQNISFKDHKLKHGITSWALTQNDKYLACCFQECLYIYDLETFFCLSSLKVSLMSTFLQIYFNKISTELITVHQDKTIKIWDFQIILENQHLVQQFDCIMEAQYSPDGLLIYYNKESKKALFIFNTKTGQHMDQINFQFIGFKVCNSGRFIYFIDQQKILIQYDLNTKKYQQMLPLAFLVEQFEFDQSQDYKLFQISGQRTSQRESFVIFLNDEEKIKLKVYLIVHLIYFSNNSEFLFCTLNRESNVISTLSIHKQLNSQNFLQFSEKPKFEHDSSIQQFVVKSDDKQLISSNFRSIYIWNIKTSELVQQLSGIQCNRMIISQTPIQFLIVIDQDNLQFYETEQLQCVGTQLKQNALNIVPCPNKYQFISISLLTQQIYGKLTRNN